MLENMYNIITIGLSVGLFFGLLCVLIAWFISLVFRFFR